MDIKNNIIASGRKRFKRTPEFAKKVVTIITEVQDKYSSILKDANWAKRLVIKIKLYIEISRRIAEISSSSNLHLRGINRGMMSMLRF